VLLVLDQSKRGKALPRCHCGRHLAGLPETAFLQAVFQPLPTVSVRARERAGWQPVRVRSGVALYTVGTQTARQGGGHQEQPAAKRGEGSFFLCPAALPVDRVPAFEGFETSKLTTLHALLDRVWDLDKAVVELARAIIKRIWHVLTTETANSRPASRIASDVATLTHVRSGLNGVAPPAAPPAAAGAFGRGAANDSGESDGGSDSASSEGQAAPPPPPPPRRGRRSVLASSQRGNGKLPAAAVRASLEAAAARRRHEQVTVSKPSDPRCLQLYIKAMGTDQFKPIVSFCVAVATDAAVNAVKPGPIATLRGVADDLSTNVDDLAAAAADAEAATGVDFMFSSACDPVARARPPPDDDPLPHASLTLAAATVRATHEQRLDMAYLLALRFNGTVYASFRKPVGAVLGNVCDTVEDCHGQREEEKGDRWALEFGEEWLDPSLSPEELLAKFRERFPHASDEPMVTRCFFPRVRQCRPGPSAAGEKQELGMGAEHYQAVRKFFSPGTFTICCACSHAKLIDFVVLEK